MTEQLTLLLNGNEYEINDAFRERVEERAARAFKKNWRFDCYWGENARGDPILNIETQGEWVPRDRLEQLEFEVQEAPADEQQSDGSDDTEGEELDSGSGMRSVPRDEVDMDTDDPTAGDEEQPPDTKFMMTHPSKNYVPQPEQDDPEKVPPHPEELPEDPSMVMWIPDNDCTEVWETGRAIVPLDMNIEWNLQKRADEAPEGSTKFVPDDDGTTREVPKTTRHDEWEGMVKRAECEKVGEVQPTDEPPEDAGTGDGDGGYSGRAADESLEGRAGGDNWHV